MIRDETRKRQRTVDQWQLAELIGEAGGRLGRGCENIDAVGVGHPIVQQAAQRLQGFRMRILRVQWIAVEADLGDQDDADQPKNGKHADHGLPLPPQERIGPDQCGEADFAALGRRNSVMRAGRKVMVKAKATSMPTPAISPSSATPAKLVGTKAKKPAAMATAASSTELPVLRKICSKATSA